MTQTPCFVFFVRDVEEQALAVKEKIASAVCRIPVEVIAEVVYVLSGVYGVDRKSMALDAGRRRNGDKGMITLSVSSRLCRGYLTRVCP